MIDRKKKIFVGLSLLLVGLLAASLLLGSVLIPFGSVLSAFFEGGSGNAIWDNIVLKSRLPQTLTALFAGAGLAVCGLQMQALFRNALAGPSVLGLTSGASLGVALAVLAVHKTGLSAGPAGILLGAVAGSCAVLVFVLSAARSIKENTTLLIVGLMTGYAASALESILKFFSNKEQIQSFVFWGFGSFSGVSPEQLGVFIPLCGAGILLAFFLIKPMDLLLFGDLYAQSMGLNVSSLRIWIIAGTGLLAGGITAYCGPIAFLGLAVPHLCRMLFRASDHKTLLPACMLLGASLALLCDLIARMPGQEQSLPLNAITSLIGAPAVLWIVLSQRGRGGYL